MISFCTLFDTNYLTRGLALYDSLLSSGEDFKLYILCFDDLAYSILNSLSLSQVVLIGLEEFETPELKRVKLERTKAEYCWTCTPHIIRFIIDNYCLDELTYLDADLLFFSQPSALIEEFRSSGSSVMITDHRYTPKYDLSILHGKYCVQFMTFKSDERGLKVLQWWQDRCLEWCYARVEEGKFGDQKYLDNWPQQFAGVHVLKHLGGGVAPWNIQQYTLSEGPKVNGVPIIFYHFHSVRWYRNNKFDLGVYELPGKTVDLIYEPYFQKLFQQLNIVRKQDNLFNVGLDYQPRNWKSIIKNVVRRFKGNYNVIQK